MQRVTGVVQHYPWGHPTFLPDLLGQEPDGRPWAELWLGTHPSGPARLDDGRPLSELTGELPFLLKVLAAAEPLSLQTHPDQTQARAGHASGRYPDPNAKPELICALTPFEALCGIRPVSATIELLSVLGLDQLALELETEGPRQVLEALLRGSIDTGPIVEACRRSERPEAVWAARLEERYPGDRSVAASLLLNLVMLQPGEAISLPPGNLHAYLNGSGIELMGASDNVVRAGLTAKPVDVDDVLAIVDTTPLVDPVLPSAERFVLPGGVASLILVRAGDAHTAEDDEIAVDLAGRAWYLAPGDRFVAGATTFVAAAGAG